MKRANTKPEKSDEYLMVRTIVISAIIVAGLAAIGILFWIQLPPFSLLIDVEVGYGTPLVMIILILVFSGVYGALLILIANLREYLRSVAGWVEVAILAILLFIVVNFMYGQIFISVGVVAIGALFTYYLHIIQ